MENNKRYKYIFCDLDGTLLDDKMRHYKCYEEIVRKYGGTCISQEEYWNGKRRKEKRTVLLEKTGFQGTYKEYITLWKEWIERDEFLSHEVVRNDTVKGLEWMRGHSESLFLVTMRQDRRQLEKQRERLKLMPYFDKIVKGMPGVQRKCEVIDHGLGAESLVIGDTEDDQELARVIGAEFLAVTCGLRERDYLDGADYYLNSFFEL